MNQRVQKVVADAGMCSRRKAEDLIREGRITINGSKAKLGDTADPEKDTIMVDSRKLVAKTRFVYIALNKPRGFLSTTKPENNMRPVTDLVKISERIYPVGRLDFDTEGLLLLTNDGHFSHTLTHPSFEVEKSYLVHIAKSFRERDVERLLNRPVIEGRAVDVRNVRLISSKQVEVTIHEGRKHIVKKLFGSMGYHVEGLVRIRIDKLHLGTLPVGKWRFLTEKEVGDLLRPRKTPRDRPA